VDGDSAASGDTGMSGTGGLDPDADVRIDQR
jgi:hypothetical protein